MDMRDYLEPEQIKEVMKMADTDMKLRAIKATDFRDTLIGLAIMGVCIMALTGGCVYATNHSKNHKKHIAKQEQLATPLIKNKQIELQK